MTYYLIRFIYAVFTWLFILSETLFFTSNEINDRTFFQSLTLFLFPFFLDYIKIFLSYEGKVGIPRCVTVYIYISFFTTCVGVAFGLGGLFSEVLNVDSSHKTLVFFNSRDIPLSDIWWITIIWVIFSIIDLIWKIIRHRKEIKRGTETTQKTRVHSEK
ncbi:MULTISPECIES: hypothetical protein [Bacillus]|uniref:hypothetical protein n=1 Tax=Bacillus TaxID=1386 RepID=UPI0001A186DF|nr:hypothetical protein [Bacillus pseudomycoides]EEM13626.1 hypothetical protein bpmyx0001_55390 [Bacillus pseudomycoides DSM 12442]MED1597521.1 hypothetical protein [Bacillus pseudomycoides]MED4714775.1 hypothetical protein [Bacillus pseudomycoides]OOR46433.1 hypothetical protein BLX05_30785 [Bacillus pseudomycoides]PDY08911.1 hypothetical protein COO16_28225 [Bacillus pseudomycoides]